MQSLLYNTLADSSTTLGVRSKLRIVVAVFVIAACAFYGQLADALTLQGDGDLAAGRSARAMSAYRRAVFFDPQSAVAVARYNTAAYFYGDQGTRKDALRYGRLILAREPKNAELLTAMGLNALRAREDYLAANVYVRLGFMRRDARCLVMAAYALHRVNDDPLARRVLAGARKIAPKNPSVLQAMRRIPERA